MFTRAVRCGMRRGAMGRALGVREGAVEGMPRNFLSAAAADTADVIFTHPTVDDGKDMYAMVEESTLDNNSSYCYLAFAQWFSKDCIIARDASTNEALGFMMGFRQPSNPSTYFVWQVGVREQARGKRLAGRILREVVARGYEDGVRFVEATVTPGNDASRNFFNRFASDVGTEAKWTEDFFAASHFPPTATHEPEGLVRIGPIPEIKPIERAE